MNNSMKVQRRAISPADQAGIENAIAGMAEGAAEREDVEAALVELADMIAAQDDALVELAELIGE